MECGGDAVVAAGLDHADGEATQECGVFGPVAGSDAAAVLIPVPVEHIMAAIFDGPVVAVEGEDALWIGGVWRVAGDAVGDFPGVSAGFLVDHVALDEKGLADAGEVEVVVEGGGGPDGAAFQAPMREGVLFTVLRLCALLEGELQVGEQIGLIAFDGEQVMGLMFEQIGGELALGQQGIGGEGFAGEIERVDEREAGADFVGLLGCLVATYREGADFFWARQPPVSA